MDKKKIEKAIKDLLEAVGEDPKREGLKNTPRRVADFYAEALEGMKVNPLDILSIYYEKENHEEIVLIKDISFYSICEHHLLPFFGKINVAYIPKKDRLLGVSKLIRVVDIFAKRFQLQERMSKQIVDSIMKAAQPYGAMVVIEAEHLCMTMRGVKKTGSKMITSAMRGIFLSDPRTRAEALSLLR
ncbi:MAG: GTP cyclohydrolase I FolE [Elusimicrobia bacterium]|nr:GTP cyclohydrolase I FolE [Elusimicrobiota bacterium]